MKKSVFSKLIAIVLSVLLMATSFAAFAGDIDGGAITTNDTTLTIPKGITMKNTSAGSYYCPNITYSYTIAPVTPPDGTVITDSTTGASSPVVAGPNDGASLDNNGQVEFTSVLVANVVPGGKEYKKNLTVNIDITKFGSPGVYRYKISDVTTTATLFTAGIVRQDDYKTDRFLDVYVKNNPSGAGVVVSGYALSQTNSATAGAKDGGYTSEYETTTSGGTVNENTDIYRTYNVRIEKKVTGDMGDKNHEFPFSVSVNNGGLYYFSTTDSNNTGDAVNGTSYTVKLKDGDTLYIRGLNPHATVGYVETNDTNETYKVKIEGKSDANESASWNTLVAETGVASNGTAALTAGAISTYDTDNSNASVATDADLTNYRDVRYTNNLASISPTGVILRYAPFILLLACAGILVLFAGRTRARRKETDAI